MIIVREIIGAVFFGVLGGIVSVFFLGSIIKESAPEKDQALARMIFLGLGVLGGFWAALKFGWL